MTALEFLTAVVRPNIEEFEANYGSERHAHNAVLSVDSLAAHLFHDLKALGKTTARDDSAFRQDMANRHPDFGILRDIAKAMKHVVLDRHNPAIRNSSQVNVKSPGWGEGRWGEARWDGPPQVHATLDNGDLRAVDYLVRSGVETIEKEMRAHGLV